MYAGISLPSTLFNEADCLFVNMEWTPLSVGQTLADGCHRGGSQSYLMFLPTLVVWRCGEPHTYLMFHTCLTLLATSAGQYRGAVGHCGQSHIALVIQHVLTEMVKSVHQTLADGCHCGNSPSYFMFHPCLTSLVMYVRLWWTVVGHCGQQRIALMMQPGIIELVK